MMDIEAQVGAELETLADSVAPSRDPWSEHLARMARRRTRVLTVVAAAAVIVAAVMVPLTVRLGAAPTPPAMHFTNPTPTAAKTMPMGTHYRSGPAVLDSASAPPAWVAGTGAKTGWLYRNKDRQLCLGVVTWDGRNEALTTPVCYPSEDQFAVRPLGGEFPDVVLFFGPDISVVHVRDAHDNPVSVSQPDGEYAVYVADFEGGSPTGAEYDAVDFDGGHHEGHL